MGYNVILDMSRMHIPYPSIGVVSSRGYIAKNRDTVIRFLQAYLEAIRDLKKEKERTVRVLAKYLKMDLESNREVLYDTYDQSVASEVIEKKPYPNLDGIKFAVDLVAQQRNISTVPDPKNFLDTTLLEELDRSRFIDKLYQ